MKIISKHSLAKYLIEHVGMNLHQDIQGIDMFINLILNTPEFM